MNSSVVNYPLLWIAVSCIVLGADYLTGPEIQFPIAFAVPVVLVSWYRHWSWGVAMAFLLPLARVWFDFAWGGTPNRLSLAVNYSIRVAVLSGLVFLVDHLAALTREVRTLRGILPICMHCKKIRIEDGSWKQIEAYVSEHSDAEFTHGLCRECAEKFYSKHLKKPGQKRNG